VYANSGSDDSFFVDVNGSPNGGYLWDINRNTNYNPDFVNDRNGADPVEFDLSAGLNTVRVSLREDGARLDKLELVCVSTAPVATPTVPAITLFNDDFNRSNNNSLNNGWTEEETGNAKMAIENGEMCVTESSDASRRPMASHTFTYMDKGKIIWSYDFDWTRSGNEGTYYLYMQLGDSNNMSKNSTSNGVAANVVWSQISGTHERLGYSNNNSLTGVATVSGLHNIVITADLDAKTYSIAVDGTTYQTGIAFDNNVSQIDTVRIFTDRLSTSNFSGRCFDNINIVTQQ
ncbi:MAG: hypothetical protein KDE51_03020, partial [Anaerolineales bacterium]|nr:hypothetical protein [Anaerolineales bacterium]